MKKKFETKEWRSTGSSAAFEAVVSAERVTRTEKIVPTECASCGAELPREAGSNNPEPKRFQVEELPPLEVELTEYQAHGRTCRRCGNVTQATVQAAIRARSVGPQLTVVLWYFSGYQGISKRGVEEIIENVFGAPISLGTVANLEQEVSAAMAPAHQEALEAVRRAAVKYADETSWKLWGKLCWLWAAATTSMAVYVIHAKRSGVGLKAIVGE